MRFHPRGEERSRRGYTTNVSAGGMYVATGRPLPSGTPVRVWVGEEGHDVVIEGVVAHSHRIARELTSTLGTSGMGVRFLSTAELLEELATPARASAAPAPADGVFPVRFASAAAFAEVYRRDAVHGGLFVRTEASAVMGSVITVEVVVAGLEPVRLEARVVHRLAPGELPGGPVGMGVQFVDRDLARRELVRLTGAPSPTG